jgi:hypothetical protein
MSFIVAGRVLLLALPAGAILDNIGIRRGKKPDTASRPSMGGEC